jgi:hypothetical protein
MTPMRTGLVDALAGLAGEATTAEIIKALGDAGRDVAVHDALVFCAEESRVGTDEAWLAAVQRNADGDARLIEGTDPPEFDGVPYASVVLFEASEPDIAPAGFVCQCGADFGEEFDEFGALLTHCWRDHYRQWHLDPASPGYIAPAGRRAGTLADL